MYQQQPLLNKIIKVFPVNKLKKILLDLKSNKHTDGIKLENIPTINTWNPIVFKNHSKVQDHKTAHINFQFGG